MSASMPEGLLERIRAEYLEMPSWYLTLEQQCDIPALKETPVNLVSDTDDLARDRLRCTSRSTSIRSRNARLWVHDSQPTASFTPAADSTSATWHSGTRITYG